MNNSKENLPLVIKENVFTKIKKFIINIFKKETVVISQEVETKIIETDNSKFKENIKHENYDEENIIKRKLNNGEIKISDLSSEEKQKMIDFYKKQIEYKTEKLNAIKTRILKLKQEA